MQIKDYLDRFEILYPNNEKIKDYRRSYNDKDFSSIFKILGDEDLRKAVMEQNLYSIFRLVKSYNTEEIEDLRKAVTEQNLHSIFRLNPNEDFRKLILEDNILCFWKILSEIVPPTTFVSSFKYFNTNNIEFNKDCFSQGQLKSKLWLIRELRKLDLNLGVVFICAGWYATLATMLLEGQFRINKIRSFDIDPSCVSIAERFNKLWEMENWKFKAITADILNLNYAKTSYTVIKPDNSTINLVDVPDTIINTSCEHIDDFKNWYAMIPEGKIVILQTNNYFEISDHVNCSNSLEEFSENTPMAKCLFQGELDLGKYKRFMRIGIR